MNISENKPKKLALNLLGHADIRLNGASIEGNFQNKVLALLAYLATTNRPHTREHLIGIFWPDIAQDTVRSNMRGALYRLRLSLGNQDFLQTSRETVRLDPESFRLDVAEFLCPMDADISCEKMESRVGLYRGPFLEGMLLEGYPDFEDWLMQKREACHRQALALLKRLIALHEKNGDIGKALGHASRFLELEPWDEDAHRKMMSLLAQDGQQIAALAQYESCREALQDELGTSPEAQTTALFERIKAGKLAPEVAKPNPFSFFGQNISEALNKPLNILIVDDHLLFRAGLCLMLGELGPDVTTFESTSCEEALALPEPEQGFDIVLLDIKFPGMSGLDGLVHFKTRFPATPVVLFSGYEDMHTIQTCYLRGASGYLTKAMDAHAIVAAIEKILTGDVAFPFGFVGSAS